MIGQNTRLEATGAEFLVLGHLLVEGIEADKTYANMPGYDILWLIQLLLSRSEFW